MSEKERAERGIELHKAAIEKTMHFARADFLKHAENTYRPLAEAYLALRQRHEKLRALGESMLDAYHGEDDLGPTFEALDDALAADEP